MLNSDLHIIGARDAAHTVELYLDLICPFSQKQLNGVYEHLVPKIEDKTLDLNLVIRQVPQPWHSSSTLVHEVMIAYAQVITEADKIQARNDQDERNRFQSTFRALINESVGQLSHQCSSRSLGRSLSLSGLSTQAKAVL